MHADGTGLRELTSDTAKDRVPRWSPNGEWLSFFSTRAGQFEIWMIRADGSGLGQLTEAKGVGFSAWAPDGARLAASTVSGVRDRVVLFDPRRPWGAQQVTSLPPPDSAIAPFTPISWSPDGTRLAGMIDTEDKGIAIDDFSTGTYDRLTTFGQYPVWLGGDRRLLFVSGGKRFYIGDVARRTTREIFSVTRDVIGPPRVPRDGTKAFFSRRSTEADIWVLTLR